MTYDQWVQTVPEVFKGDTLWKLEAYRLGVFVKDLAWHDITRLLKDRRTRGLADQKHRAIGSISTNISEAFHAQRENSEPVSTNTPLARLVNPETGITSAAMFWARRSQRIAWNFSPKSFGSS